MNGYSPGTRNVTVVVPDAPAGMVTSVGRDAWTGSVPVRFLAGRILHCSGSQERSEDVLTELLAEPSLTDEWEDAVTDELSAVESGQGCA